MLSRVTKEILRIEGIDPERAYNKYVPDDRRSSLESQLVKIMDLDRKCLGIDLGTMLRIKEKSNLRAEHRN